MTWILEKFCGTHCLNDAKFYVTYCISRCNLGKILEIIKNHPLFQDQTVCGRNHGFVASQLMPFLKFSGITYLGEDRTSNTFSIGYITHFVYCGRVVNAIISLTENVLQCPNEKESRTIVNRTKDTYSFVNCIRVRDGTLFLLTYQSIHSDSPD